MSENLFPLAGQSFYPESKITEADRQRQERERNERINRAIKERQAAEAAHAQEVEAAGRAAGSQRLEAYRDTAHARWLAEGGDEAGFTKNWPDLRDRYLREAITRTPLDELLAKARRGGYMEELR